MKSCLGLGNRAMNADVDTLQDAHLQTVVEVLQSIKASEMTPMLQRIYSSEGGPELLDVLMKYLCVVAPPNSPSLFVRRHSTPLSVGPC